MLEPALQNMLKIVPNRYKLVNIIAQRAREIGDDAKLTGVILKDKPLNIAIREVAYGASSD